jgi:hypothetical protein
MNRQCGRKKGRKTGKGKNIKGLGERKGSEHCPTASSYIYEYVQYIGHNYRYLDTPICTYSKALN